MLKKTLDEIPRTEVHMLYSEVYFKPMFRTDETEQASGDY